MSEVANLDTFSWISDANTALTKVDSSHNQEKQDSFHDWSGLFADLFETELIKKCKETIKLNQIIIIDSNKNDVYAFTLKSNNLYLSILNIFKYI